MTQLTSIEAYKDMLPTLSERQISVLDYIAAHPGETNKEIAAGMGWAINEVTPRVLELRKLQLVVFAGTRVVDGRSAMSWRARA